MFTTFICTAKTFGFESKFSNRTQLAVATIPNRLCGIVEYLDKIAKRDMKNQLEDDAEVELRSFVALKGRSDSHGSAVLSLKAEECESLKRFMTGVTSPTS